MDRSQFIARKPATEPTEWSDAVVMVHEAMRKVAESGYPGPRHAGRGRGRHHHDHRKGRGRHGKERAKKCWNEDRIGKRPLKDVGDEVGRALEAACNKLSYENFEKIYSVIKEAIESAKADDPESAKADDPETANFETASRDDETHDERSKRDVVVAIVKRASGSGTYIDLYIRAIKRLQREGLGMPVVSAVSYMAGEFRAQGLLVRELGDEAEYDDFCGHLLDKRNRLGMLKVLVKACDPNDVNALADSVLRDFATAMTNPGFAMDLVFDGMAIIHDQCPERRSDATAAICNARDSGTLSTRSKFQVMDLLESQDRLSHRTKTQSHAGGTIQARAARR